MKTTQQQQQQRHVMVRVGGLCVCKVCRVKWPCLGKYEEIKEDAKREAQQK